MPLAAGAGGALLMRHALRRLEQAAARHREVAAAGAWTTTTMQQRQASCSSSSPPAAAAPASADPGDGHHHHHHHHQPYPPAISASSLPPSIWRRASPPPPPSPSARASPPLPDQTRAFSLLAGLANLVNPPSEGTTKDPNTTTNTSTHSRRSYRERRLVGYEPAQLLGVVSDVARYREFVPWCRSSRVLRASSDGREMEAELEVGFQALSETYVSRVRLGGPLLQAEEDGAAPAATTTPTTPTPTPTPPTSPTPPLAVVEATTSRSLLFEHLASTWTLRPGPQPGTTWLAFAVEFGFASPAHRHVADLFFDQVVRRMVAAFEGRCAELYGPSALERRH